MLFTLRCRVKKSGIVDTTQYGGKFFVKVLLVLDDSRKVQEGVWNIICGDCLYKIVKLPGQDVLLFIWIIRIYQPARHSLVF